MSERRKKRIRRLNSLGAVRQELGSLYRAWRNGELDDSALRAGTYCLRELRECLVAGDLEERIERLEGIRHEGH